MFFNDPRHPKNTQPKAQPRDILGKNPAHTFFGGPVKELVAVQPWAIVSGPKKDPRKKGPKTLPGGH